MVYYKPAYVLSSSSLTRRIGSFERDTGPNHKMSSKKSDSTPQTGWNWAGIASPDTAGRVKIPPVLSDVGLFDDFSRAHWGHETTTGTIVVSPSDLEVSEYDTVASTVIGGANDGHRSTVPHQYKPGGSECAYLEAQNREITVSDEELLHFVYPDEALNQENGWCYVLTTTELEQRLLAPSDWPETVHMQQKPLYTRV